MRLTESVLPDPVCAMPTTSCPLSAIGQPCAWIGVGLDQFCCCRTPCTYSFTTTSKYLTSGHFRHNIPVHYWPLTIARWQCAAYHCSWSTLGPTSTGMVGIAFWYVTSQPGQLSLAIPPRGVNRYSTWCNSPYLCSCKLLSAKEISAPLWTRVARERLFYT